MDTTVAKGFAVLEVLARAKRPLRLNAVTDSLGLPKSNVYRLLSTLVELGYVNKDAETARYWASLKTWELGVAVISTNTLRRAVSPYLQKLHEATGETVLLTVPAGPDQVLFLDRVAPSRALRYTPLNGTRASMVLTAAGRVFLSAMPDPQPAILSGLAQVGPEKGLDVEAILAELPQIRERGFAVVDGGITRHARAVAAPVESVDGPPVAAITISGSDERMVGPRLSEATDLLLSVCAEVGALSSI